MPQLPPYRPSLLEPLETRKLMAASDFGDAGTQIRFSEAETAYPTIKGQGQVIAVVDSGIDYTHPSLGGGFGPTKKVIGGYDFVDSDPDPMDTFGHGTEVAGIIAGSAAIDNSSDYQGIAPDAKLVALRIDGDGQSPVPDSRIEQALQWVLQHRVEFGITVVNISYGQGEYSHPTVSTIYGDEVQSLHDSGVAIVAAAGNGGIATNFGINTPAADPNVISVSAVDENNNLASFSKRGPLTSILAPGEGVLTTFGFAGYGLVDGTSYSTPIVAGTIALMRNIDSSLTPTDALSILRASGTATFDGGPKSQMLTRQFYPRLDLLNALNLTKDRRPGTQFQQLIVGKTGNQNSIAIDKQGVTHFVYYDAPTQTMKYATRNSAGEWSQTMNIDNSLPFQGYYLSMALDSQGQPSVAYFDGTNGDLKFARFDGSIWNLTNIDSKNSTGAYPSLTFDRNGFALITYYRKTTGDLRAARQDATGNWAITTVDSTGDVGRSTTAALAPNGAVGVAYEDSTHGWLKYALLDPRAGTWANTVVDKKTLGVAYVALAYSTDDAAPWISYYDAYPADLKVAHFANRGWATQKVATRGATGLFTSLYFADADQPNVVYYDKRADALYVSEENAGQWTTSLLQSNAGRFATSAVDRNNNVVRYTYYTASTPYVKFGERFI
jgi:subtilisin family serine protease